MLIKNTFTHASVNFYLSVLSDQALQKFDTDGILVRIFQKNWFWKKSTVDKKHAKLPTLHSDLPFFHTKSVQSIEMQNQLN